ncbi:MAG: Peroxiredoxin-like, partial [uncultured Thermomicrobiales bacterium]
GNHRAGRSRAVHRGNFRGRRRIAARARGCTGRWSRGVGDLQEFLPGKQDGFPVPGTAAPAARRRRVDGARSIAGLRERDPLVRSPRRRQLPDPDRTRRVPDFPRVRDHGHADDLPAQGRRGVLRDDGVLQRSAQRTRARHRRRGRGAGVRSVHRSGRGNPDFCPRL